MSDGQILSIGKSVMPQTAGTDTVKRQNEAAEVMFADVISMGTSLQTENKTLEPADKAISSMKSDKSETCGENVSTAYEKYQYKEITIYSEPETETECNIEVIREELKLFSEKIVEVLCEELHVSEEEINEAMSVLGLQFLDLLDASNLANLVVKLDGSEKVNQLLCSESFTVVFKKVNELGNEMLDNLHMTIDELQKMDVFKTENFTEQLRQVDVKELSEEIVIKPEEHLPQDVKDVKEIKEVKEDIVQEHVEKETIVVKDVQNESENSGQMEQEHLTKDDDFLKTDEKQNPQIDESENSGQMEQEHLTKDDDFLKTDEKQNPQIDEPKTETNTAFDMKLSEIVENRLGSTTVEGLPSKVSVTDIIEQFVEHTKVTLSAEVTKMEMQLNPEHLGKLYLEVSENQGTITAKIQTQNAVVKEALEMQIADLKQNLNQTGVKVDAIEVTIASHEFERNLEQDENSKKQQDDTAKKQDRHRSIDLNHLDEVSGVMSEEEELVAKMMAEQGNRVDLTA